MHLHSLFGDRSNPPKRGRKCDSIPTDMTPHRQNGRVHFHGRHLDGLVGRHPSKVWGDDLDVVVALDPFHDLGLIEHSTLGSGPRDQQHNRSGPGSRLGLVSGRQRRLAVHGRSIRRALSHSQVLQCGCLQRMSCCSVRFGLMGVGVKPRKRKRGKAETSRMRLVLFGMQNRTSVPLWQPFIGSSFHLRGTWGILAPGVSLLRMLPYLAGST
jgi:hypothetical protein